MVHQKVSTKPKEIYGITGAKGHGKDTLARLIVGSGTQGAGFTVTHFAAALKRLCMDVFGLTDYDVNDPVGKEEALRSPIVLDDSLAALQRVTGLPIRAHGKIAKTPRELLQLVGSEYVRAECGTYWLDQLTPLLEAKRRVLVPDARFPNEAEFIRHHGGRVIRVIRIDAEASGDGHMSETEGLKIEADLVLGVRTGDLSLVERVAHLLSKGKWESAMRYDYRRIRTAIALYQSAETLEKCVNAIGVKNDDSQAFRCILAYYGVPQRRPGTAMNPHRFEGDVEQKQCRTCSEWQPLASFSKNSKAWDQLHWVCKPCASLDHKKRYALYEKEGSLITLFREAKVGAERRALPFNLSQADFEALWEKQGGRCFYTKELMVLTKGAANKVSVDRLDSTVGYETGNVVLCCSRVNLMKGPLSLNEFKSLVQRLAEQAPWWGVTMAPQASTSSEDQDLIEAARRRDNGTLDQLYQTVDQVIADHFNTLTLEQDTPMARIAQAEDTAFLKMLRELPPRTLPQSAREAEDFEFRKLIEKTHSPAEVEQAMNRRLRETIAYLEKTEPDATRIAQRLAGLT